MPWKSISLVGARVRFMKLALKAQQPFQHLCRLFHISCKTGYKWKGRFLHQGRCGLRDRSRRPKRSPHRILAWWKRRIRRLRRRHRHWGARKIHAWLRQQHGRKIPAVRTIGRCLQRLGLSKTRRRLRPTGPVIIRADLTSARASNHVWTVDFKGWFRTRDGRRVEPLTVRDLFSRYLLAVWLLPDQQWWRVKALFILLFRRYGLPKIIRVDNGGPFGSKGPAGLTRLSAWWAALGIRVEFIAPGHPEQNGGHEQMHKVLKAETTIPASSTMRAQQRRLNRWLWIYNRERPHEALRQRTPAQCYQPRRGSHSKLVPVLNYPKTWEQRRVRSNGEIRWQGRLRFVGEAFVGFKVGFKPLSPTKWRIYLGKIVLGELQTSDAGGLRPAAYVRQHPTKPNKKV